MKATEPTTRGLIVRLVILVVWGALFTVSVIGGVPFRIAISTIGLLATLATVIIWVVQRRRMDASRSDDSAE